MIGYLEGIVLGCDGKKVTIKVLVQGIGYEVNYNQLVPVDSKLKLFIYHNITDSDQNLWGFSSLEEKSFFVLLKSVNKVGASKAFALLTSLGINEIVSAISLDSPNMLAKAPGIGKKMAEQIILSLKDKIGDAQLPLNSVTSSSEDSFDKTLFQEVVMALDALGYKDSQVGKLIKQQMKDGQNSSQEIIKSVLREL